ncbi:MAG TPA: alkaline phosphatase family protein [Kofleriaceae bacterium]
MQRIAALAIAVVLAALAWQLPQVRRRLLRDITHWDAVPSEPAAFAGSAEPTAPGLAPVARTRVVLIDGLSAEVAASLPVWGAACARGVRATIDVGFPTVSLPIEVSLWSGLTQQQTGIVNRYERPLIPPLQGIPSRIAGSWAVAENHGWIVRSLGFSRVEPAADPADPKQVADAAPAAWAAQWLPRAMTAVQSDAPLVFVHVLEVDTAGHQHGGDSAAYRAAAGHADGVLGQLLAAAPDARWFLLSDHGHLPGGGHGGEERELRQVEGCIAGPGVAAVTAGLVHLVDVARAIADSTGLAPAPGARGRPLTAALAHPLAADDALPALALGGGAIALLVLAAGLGLTMWTTRAWWLAPWWFALGCVALIAIRGEPTLSAPYIYKPAGRDMYLVWLPLLALAGAATWFGARRTALWRVATAQLALPFAAAGFAVTAAGAWAAVGGAEVAPVVPRFTGYMSPLLLMAAHGAAAVALAALATFVRLVFDRRARPAPPRSAP